MTIMRSMKAFFASIITFISKLPITSRPPPSPTVSTSPSIVDLESQGISALNVPQQNRNRFLLRWKNAVMAFFTSIITFLSKFPTRSSPPSSPTVPTALSIVNSESQQVSSSNIPQQNPNQFLLQWQNAIIEFCFTLALGVALQFAQIKSQLSLSFRLLSFLILLIFLSLFVAKFIHKKFLVASQVLEKVAMFLGATSFIITIAIPFPPSLKYVAWALYVVCLLIVVLSNHFFGI